MMNIPIEINHVYKEANYVVDWCVSYGLHLNLGFHVQHPLKNLWRCSKRIMLGFLCPESLVANQISPRIKKKKTSNTFQNVPTNYVKEMCQQIQLKLINEDKIF